MYYVWYLLRFLRGRLAELVSLLSGRNFETREFEESIAEESYNKLRDGVFEFINKTNFDRFVMIVKSSGIIDKSLIRSDNALNFAYALFILLRRKNIIRIILKLL